MTNEIDDSKLNEAAGGKAVNGRYYTTVLTGWAPYQLKDGDTLGNIAAERGLSVPWICSANPLIDNPQRVYAGCWILLPIKK